MKPLRFSIALGMAAALSACTGPIGAAAHPHASRPFVQLVRLGRSVGPPQLAGDVIVYPARASRGDDWNEVRSVDLSSGHRAVLAHSGFPHGMINWAARTGDWTVYVDQSAVQSDKDPYVLWRVRAIKDGARRAVLLDDSGSTPSADVPSLSAEGSAIQWSKLRRDGTGTFLWWQPGWRGPRTVHHGALVPEGMEDAGGTVVSVGNGDCWTATPEEPTFVRRTSSRRVLDCSAAGQWLVWRERAHPTELDSDPESPDEPFRLWARHAAGKPFVIETGDMAATYPYLAGHVLLYKDTEDRYVLQDLTRRSRRVRFPSYSLDLYDPFGAGHRIGFITESGTNHVDTAHVIDVRAPWRADPRKLD